MKPSKDFEVTLEIVKKRQHIAYYDGKLAAIEEMRDALLDHYFKDNEMARGAVYECADSMYGFYESCLVEEEEAVKELLGEKEKSNVVA